MSANTVGPLVSRILRGRATAIGTLLVLVGLLVGLAGSWIHVKAEVAQVLLAKSWQRAQLSGEGVTPWPWADYRVVGRLRVPALNIEQYVFDDDSGSALAFAPGISAMSLELGSTVISGHRDTHFTFLKDLSVGSRVSLEFLGRGRATTYRVEQALVVDSRSQGLPPVIPGGLLLITCFPFDALVPGGPLRYVIIAKPELPKLVGMVSF